MLKQIKEKLENADCFDDAIDEVIENTPLEQKIQLAVELIKKYDLQDELDDLISSGLISIPYRFSTNQFLCAITVENHVNFNSL